MKRPVFLTIWLVLLVLSHIYSIFSYILGSAALSAALPNRPVWYYPVMIIFSLVALVAVYMLWKWKKMGFYLMVGIAVLNVLISMVIFGAANAGLSIILLAAGVAILYFAMRPAWSNFK